MTNITFNLLYATLSRVRKGDDIRILLPSSVDFSSLYYIKHLVLPENNKNFWKVTTMKQENGIWIEYIKVFYQNKIIKQILYIKQLWLIIFYQKINKQLEKITLYKILEQKVIEII